ncbi:MAG TPA: hypothetical protein VK540_10005 [Polyangiaceae bacterium]|nr:hypothetical protein [Polyangiaceae bacterium]
MASTVVNEVPYDFYSMEVEISIAGESFGIVKGIEEIEYTTTFNREKLRGGSRKPLLRTDGDVDYEGSITWLKSWFDYLCDKSRELKIPLADLELLVNFSYAHKGEVLHTDTLVGVKLAEIGNSHSRGPDGLQTTSPLDVMDIFYDGVNVFGETLASDK